ncbi:MAG TPA: hypothetical protein DCR68_01015 [Coprothermobacter sp.]|jgi:hypothetical protein|nr:hypothetical protein [Coprothermobacter sp.]
MRYSMVVAGIILLVVFVGSAYFVTYKPWMFVFNVPEYSNYEKSWSGQKNLKEIVGFYVPGMSTVQFDLRKRQISMNLVLTKPEGCVVVNGDTLVFVGAKTIEGDLYSAKVLKECVTVDAWDESRMKVTNALKAQGITPIAIKFSDGFFEVTGKRQCGNGVIKVTVENLDKLGFIKDFWGDCQYHEYRLLYDSGAVLK